MDLTLDRSLAEDYKSPSQIARVLTESWFEKEMYCLNCSSDTLKKLPDNTKVKDFVCPDCKETYQLKSKSSKFGNKVANSAYEPKVKRIKEGKSPNWAFLQYDKEDYFIENLMIVPNYFMTLDTVEARKPLSEDARRSGWVGSNILLKELPTEARLYVVKEGEVGNEIEIREKWKKFDFMREESLSSKGWKKDVLKCVRELDKEEFTLDEIYEFEDRLQEIHPENKHIKAKIRQQLQKLRDEGVLEFVDYEGKYHLLL